MATAANVKMSTKTFLKSSIQANAAPLLKQLDNYIIVDVGANLTNKKFSRDLDSVLQRAKDSGEALGMVARNQIKALASQHNFSPVLVKL